MKSTVARTLGCFLSILSVIECSAVSEIGTTDFADLRARVCPDGFCNGCDHCYKIVDDAITWDEARIACSATYNARLAVIRNSKDSACLIDYQHSLIGRDRTRLWIGLRKTSATAEWSWIDGTIYTYTDWSPGEPNNQGGNELCVLVESNSKWNDCRRDHRSAGYICETERRPVGHATTAGFALDTTGPSDTATTTTPFESVIVRKYITETPSSITTESPTSTTTDPPTEVTTTSTGTTGNDHTSITIPSSRPSVELTVTCALGNVHFSDDNVNQTDALRATLTTDDSYACLEVLYEAHSWILAQRVQSSRRSRRSWGVPPTVVQCHAGGLYVSNEAADESETDKMVFSTTGNLACRLLFVEFLNYVLSLSSGPL